MKYINLIISAFLLQFTFTGCSYVSDMVEGAITDRASFSIDASYNSATQEVTITWDNSDLSSDFAGIEIYRTREANNEYSGYITVADRWDPSAPALGSGSAGSYSYTESEAGLYFYRVGFIHWDEPIDEDTGIRPYTEDEPNYNIHTDINAVSGSAGVNIN